MKRVGYIKKGGREEIGVSVDRKTIPLSQAILQYKPIKGNLEDVIKNLKLLEEIEVVKYG